MNEHHEESSQSRNEVDTAALLLTEVELELMTILWRLEKGSVNDVLEQLPAQRDLAYTSVSTILRILTKKGFLNAQKEGRGHIYVPTLSKANYEARAVNDVVTRVFDGAPVALVRHLLDRSEMDKETILELKALLQKVEAGQ